MKMRQDVKNDNYILNVLNLLTNRNKTKKTDLLKYTNRFII